MTQMPHLSGPDEGEALWFFGTLLLFKASSEQTGGLFCLAEQVGRRGIATPLHRQPGDEETFHVLEGELRFYLGDQGPITARAGSTAYVPPGAVHAFEVLSDTARWLDLTTPNHEAFFRAAGEQATERTLPPEMAPDLTKVALAAERFGVEILGPPPGTDPHADR